MRSVYRASSARADPLQDLVRLGEVLAVRAFALDQVRHRVEPQPVDAEIEPEPHDADDRVEHRRVVVVQIGLMGEEAVPVVLPSAASSHVQFDFSVSVKMIRARVLLVGVAPDVEVALGRAWRRAARRWNQGC